MTDARADARSTGDQAASEEIPSGGWTWIAAIWCAGAFFDASQTLLTMHVVGVAKGLASPIFDRICLLATLGTCNAVHHCTGATMANRSGRDLQGDEPASGGIRRD